MTRRYRTPLGVASLLALLLIVAEALGGALGDIGDQDPRERVLELLPQQDDVLINLDPVDLPSTTDMVRLGRRATPAILNGLVNSMSPEVRSACAAVLTATRDPRGIEPLIDALDDPSDGVRFLALQALGTVESRQATPRLLELLRKPGTPAYVRNEAVRTLGRIGDPKAVDPLLSYFRSTWDSAAQQALWDMRELLSARQLEQVVVPPLEASGDRRPPQQVLAFAIERAGDLRIDDAVDPLEELFEANKGLQNRIVYNLGRIGDRSATKLLRGLLDSAAEPRLLNNVTFALKRLGEDVTPFLRDALADRRVYIRFNAAFVAGDLAEARLVPELEKALTDPNDYVRSEAAVALGKIKAPTSVGPLEEASRDENAVVRRDAILALAEIDYPKYRERVVEELLTSEEPVVQEKAGRFLAQRGDPEIVADVLGALEADNYGDQALAVQYLGRFYTLDDPNATAFLLRLAAEGGYRHDALRLLARFADERSRFILRQWLTSPSGEQDQLLRAMGRFADKDSKGLAEAWLQAPDEVTSQLYGAFLLASLGEKAGSDRLLIALEDGPPELKRVSAQILTELDLSRVPGVADALAGMLDAEDVYVRLYAARALAQRGDGRAFVRLKAELDKRIPFVRDEVLDIVERAPRKLAEPVMRKWMESGNPHIKRELERILDKT